MLGSIGPGTKLPTLGHVAVRRRCATRTRSNAAGLIDGGADASDHRDRQDLLQTKAAVIGAKRAMADAGPVDVPLIVT